MLRARIAELQSNGGQIVAKDRLNENRIQAELQRSEKSGEKVLSG